MNGLRTSLLSCLFSIFLANVTHGAELGARLETVLSEIGPGEQVSVIVELADRVDLSAYNRGRESANEMIVALRQKATETQPALREFLASRGVVGVRDYWINNSLAFDATPELLNELLANSGVGTIYFASPASFDPVEVDPTENRSWDWNMEVIRADEVWLDLGLSGAGIVIGFIDTGVYVEHEALIGKWRGGDNSWMDFANGQPDPYDDHGHGTAVAGVLVGGDGPGPFYADPGVAYGAQYIAAKMYYADGELAYPDAPIDAAQWMLDPDDNPQTNDFPHIASCSWGWLYQTEIFYSSAEAWQAAGIVPVFAIGNEGPDPSTTRPPGNYNNTLGVGATTSLDDVWIDSSRGPSPVGPAYPDDQRKPDLCAPGVLIQTATRSGGYGYWTGTSFAAPHVAGTVALMLESDPSLSFEDVRDAFWQLSLDIDEPGYDYGAGYGRLDAYAAVTGELLSVSLPGDLANPVLRATPNPFRGQVWIRSTSPRMSEARLTIYSVSGRRVRELEIPAGADGWVWGGSDAHGHPLPAGIYLLNIRANGEHHSERVVLLR